MGPSCRQRADGRQRPKRAYGRIRRPPVLFPAVQIPHGARRRRFACHPEFSVSYLILFIFMLLLLRPHSQHKQFIADDSFDPRMSAFNRCKKITLRAKESVFRILNQHLSTDILNYLLSNSKSSTQGIY